MNILVTIDRNYLHPLAVMLKSLSENNPEPLEVFVASRSLRPHDIRGIERLVGERNLFLHNIHISTDFVPNAPTSGRYPPEIYDRLFAAYYLPRNMDRILYLDPDIVVLKPIGSLYNMELGDFYYAAASHVNGFGEVFNNIRLRSDVGTVYINSGVLLMNLKKLRQIQNYNEVKDYIRTHYLNLTLPDQDILSGLYGPNIYQLDPVVYNMTERIFRRAAALYGEDQARKYVEDRTKIIHYIGRNKPWKKNDSGYLSVWYEKYARRLNEEETPQRQTESKTDE